MRLTAGFFPLSPAARFTLFPARYSVPRKGKNPITSDGIFADLLLSPSSRSARHLPFPKGEAWGKAPRTSYHKGRWGERAKRKGDNVLQQIRVSPVPSESGYVKTRRRVADSRRVRKFRRRECTQKYMTETNTGETGRCALIPRFALSSKRVTVKTRRYKLCAKAAEVRGEFT